MGTKSAYDACMNVPNLMKMGLSQQAAIVYVDVAAQLGYECGPGYAGTFCRVVHTGK